MKERCGEGKFKFIGRAYLKGYLFVYVGYSEYRKGAVANIIEKEDSVVWGGLYEIDSECLCKLDKYEGCPCVYQRKLLTVITDDGREFQAYVYFRKEKIQEKPSEEYLEIVLSGAKDCNLPE
ncbi:MAG: gamma-glutamylcyclotransferase family protein, partial [Elusimicrobiota bacterium]|nr:gamma-glutamylcyclotransferase [Endomicrobiia bacterium]MDW8165977.1 gamma-glutamylcyclotransferase family protein [Elusimicrobiota bacterium]